MSLKTTQNIQT